MNGSVTVIDIVAQVTDETSIGARSAEANVSKLEHSMMNLQKQIMGIKGKSKLEVSTTLKDKASKGIQSVASAGKKIAGKVWEVSATLKDKTSKGIQSVANASKKIAGNVWETSATLKDMASKGIQGVANAGKKIAGKVWTVTLKAVDLVTAPFKKVLGLIANPIAGAAAFAGVSLGAADTINTFKGFEQGMANVKAITGSVSDEVLPGVMQAAKDLGISFQEGANATETSMNILTATAKHLGETTMFSAAQASEAMENLAMAGWKSKDIVAGMPGLLDLAAAGSVDLATAADVTSSALAQFSLDAEEAKRVADVLAATATNSKTDVAGLGESLKMAGTQAGALGYSIEDTALALGLMGNAGVDASSAGTALRSTLARMSKQEGMTAEEANAMAQAMKKVGVSLTDSQGESKSLLTVMKELRAGFAGMTKTEKAATAANLAGMYAQSGLLAIVNASDEKFNELAAAIGNAEGAASKMAGVKMDTLQGSLYYLQSAAEGVKIAIGEKLSPYVKRLADWMTAHMPDVQKAVGSAVDFILGKIDDVSASIRSLTNSPEWQNAETFGNKIKLAWNKLIAEPFDKWWNGTGKAWMSEKANNIGEGLGTALKTGVLALLGVDAGGAVADGVDIGKSFADGFLEGFDGAEVAKAIVKAILSGTKNLALDAVTLLPGGKEATATSGLSAAVLGFGAFKTAMLAGTAIRGGKALWNGARTVRDVASGVKIFNAAANGSRAAESTLGMAQAGELGAGTGFGAAIAPAVNALAKAAPFIAGAAAAIQTGADAYHGVQKSEEWTGSNSTGAKIASGIGAATGGLGDGLMGDESIGRKASNIAGGALKGAGIGAVAGSILPGVGTAIGAGVGAGIGAAGAAIGGSNIAKALSAAGAAVGGFFTETVPQKFGEFAEGAKDLFNNTIAPALSTAETAVKGFFVETVPEKFWEFRDSVTGFVTESIPQALSSVESAVKGFFTETVPAKFGELVQGVGGFFTQTVPYAIGYAAGKVQTFFIETVPEFFGNLVEGVTNFFTQTVPAAIETAGSALNTFFTQSVPEFLAGLWNGLTNFFIVTVPAAIDMVGSAVTNFFIATVPQFFSDLWSGITGFFVTTVQPAIETVGAAVTNFFAVTIPGFFAQLWDGVTGFFSETVPRALETVGTALSTFFAETVPDFFSDLWDGVENFFTKAIPNAISSIGKTISGFFDNAKEKISSFFGGLWNKVTGSAAAGYVAATATPHAEGGIMTRPHLGLVAEDGAEAIIPLSGVRRERGLKLWEQTGEMLGVRPYADGGIVGAAAAKNGVFQMPGEKKPEQDDNTSEKQPSVQNSPPSGGGPYLAGGMSVPVTIQSLTVEINVDGGAQNPQELTAAIRENIRGMTDDIAYQLAVAIQQVYANTPKEGWR